MGWRWWWVSTSRSCGAQKKSGMHLVEEGPDVCGDGGIAGLDSDLLDAQADVDHPSLFSLCHDHANEGILYVL